MAAPNGSFLLLFFVVVSFISKAAVSMECLTPIKQRESTAAQGCQ